MGLGERIRGRRKHLKMNQDEFADRAGVVRQTVSSWENNVFVPEGKKLEKVASALNTSVAYLLGEVDDPAPPRFDGRITSVESEPQKHTEMTSQSTLHSIDSLTWIPVISPEVKVSAGAGNCCEEIVWEEIDRFPLFDGKIAALYSDNGLLSIYVDGDSMEPQIHDGDLVIFKKSHEWVSGNIVVVCLDGRLMVKGIVKGPEGETRLRSLNKEYEDIIIGKASFFLVYGRVLKIVRQWDPKPVL